MTEVHSTAWDREYAIESEMPNEANRLYNEGKIDYVHYSPFYDSQIIRLSALHSLCTRPAPAADLPQEVQQ